MGFFIARVSGALLAFVLSLLALALRGLLRGRLKNKKGHSTVFSFFAALGAAAAVYIAAAAILNLFKYSSGPSSIATVTAPLLLFAVLLALHFALLCGGQARPGLLAASSLWAALAAFLQCALLLFNLVLRWNNFTRGMLEYLYIQILLSALSAGTAVMFLSGFFALKKTAGAVPSRLGALDEHYRKLGIQRGNVALWEDGTRTGAGEKGSYEWWYFDAHLDDGTSLVAVFYTKPMMSPESAADPHVTFRLIVPGEPEYSAVLRPERGEFSASKERCDVRIGDCYFRGDLRTYEIYYRDAAVEAKLVLESSVPPWRPETGHIFFGKNDERYFAWLPSVPEGKVRADITRNGRRTQQGGTGYHDHNWGNVNMRKILHHWYWGRARIGEYRIITSFIWAEQDYGYNEFPIFMIAQENNILADDGAKLRFAPERAFVEKETGKPVHDLLVYDYQDEKTRWRISYTRKKSILNFPMVNDVSGALRLLAKLSGFDGAYHRFTGDVVLERFEGETAVETVEGPALWELMYFGKTIGSVRKPG